MHLKEDGFHPTQISMEVVAYGVRTNKHSDHVFYFVHGPIEVKVG